VKLAFANPVDIRRYLGEFYNLARSMKKAQEASKGAVSLARDFEQLVALGQEGKLDANDSHVVHIRRLALGSTRSSSGPRTSTSSRAATPAWSGSASMACCTRSTPFRRRAGGDDLAISCSRGWRSSRSAAADGRIKTVTPAGEEVELRISTMPTASARRS